MRGHIKVDEWETETHKYTMLHHRVLTPEEYCVVIERPKKMPVAKENA